MLNLSNKMKDTEKLQTAIDSFLSWLHAVNLDLTKEYLLIKKL
jgi:hypothetical protein